ncbi:MAG: methyltransferase domain-containing protein [Phormidesmis sp.]
MAWRHVIYPVMTYFRRRRLAELLTTYPNLKDYSVLDVGGRPFIWDLLKAQYGVVPKQLVLLNTPSEEEIPTSPDYAVKIADGRHLPYPDKSFDLVFSNSVIEHVGEAEQMAQFANECDRVGKGLYIQTPNRWFPLEAHFGAAFIHWLPRDWYQKLSFLSLRYFFAINNPAEQAYFKQEFDTTRLLSLKQFKHLFPEKKIAAEKVLGFTKSFAVISLPTGDLPAVKGKAPASSVSSEPTNINPPSIGTLATCEDV